MRLFRATLPLLFLATVLSCRRQELQSDRLNLVCTFLPVYVTALNVVGDAPNVEIEMLVAADAGCPHDYTVRPSDAKRIARADWVLANGLGMEPFLDDLLRGDARAKLITISDDCELLIAEHDHSRCGHDHAHAPQMVNGHAWLSPREAAQQARVLARKLGETDRMRAARYRANAEAYGARLEALHQRMVEASKSFARRKIVTSHDAFAYLARDLDLTVVATLSADPNHAPSLAELTLVVDQVRQTQAAAIFFEPGPAERIARMVAKETGVKAWELNPLNTWTGKPTADLYERIQLENLRVLQESLGGGS
jgi:zinc transport system substrate-binding protein